MQQGLLTDAAAAQLTVLAMLLLHCVYSWSKQCLMCVHVLAATQCSAGEQCLAAVRSIDASPSKRHSICTLCPVSVVLAALPMSCGSTSAMQSLVIVSTSLQRYREQFAISACTLCLCATQHVRIRIQVLPAQCDGCAL
jgi:hypothetical protein